MLEKAFIILCCGQIRGLKSKHICGVVKHLVKVNQSNKIACT